MAAEVCATLPQDMLDVLECPICLRTFDGHTRQAKVLLCGHTLCHACIQSIIADASVTCPSCRETTQQSVIRTNYMVDAIVEKLCQFCLKSPRAKFCTHCSQHLCASCFKRDLKIVFTDTKEKIGEATAIVEVGEKTRSEKDVTASVHESLDALRADAKSLKRALDQTVEEMEREILKTSNVGMYSTWRTKLNRQIKDGREFIDKQRDLMSSKSPADDFTDESVLIEVAEKCEALVAEMKTCLENVPPVNRCKYKKSKLYSGAFRDQLKKLIPVTKEVAADVDGTCAVGPQNWPLAANESSRIDYDRATDFQMSTGAHGKAAGQFNDPLDVAILENDHIWVTDRGNNRVQKFTNNLGFISNLGGMPRKFLFPTGICSSSDTSALFVLDSSEDRLKAFSRSGLFLRSFELSDIDYRMMFGITYGPDRRLYTTDQKNFCVKVFKEGGVLERTVGARGSGPGQFDSAPCYIAVTSDGRLLVTDIGAQRTCRVFSPTGEFLESYPKGLPTAFGRCEPSGVAVDCDDNILLCDDNGGRVYVLDSRGVYKHCLGKHGGSLGGIAVDRKGTVVVCDRTYHKVHKYQFALNKKSKRTR